MLLTKITITIKTDDVFSLKEKRSVVRNIKNYVQKNFNACISESHDNDSLRRIGFTIGILLSHPDELSSILDTITLHMEEISTGMIENESHDFI
ncbi:MAG TPA: DUF503 family protein [Thermotogota bacterium]|nr:DUF503 family protein [Thermotogota bacterium]HPJ87538.1 DUF503 family protein [Thermotogota bacterium]HPR94743.1 DUF503 family protein [Thermotogota bacterium]